MRHKIDAIDFSIDIPESMELTNKFLTKLSIGIKNEEIYSKIHKISNDMMVFEDDEKGSYLSVGPDNVNINESINFDADYIYNKINDISNHVFKNKDIIDEEIKILGIRFSFTDFKDEYVDCIKKFYNIVNSEIFLKEDKDKCLLHSVKLLLRNGEYVHRVTIENRWDSINVNIETNISNYEEITELIVDIVETQIEKISKYLENINIY